MYVAAYTDIRGDTPLIVLLENDVVRVVEQQEGLLIIEQECCREALNRAWRPGTHVCIRWEDGFQGGELGGGGGEMPGGQKNETRRAGECYVPGCILTRGVREGEQTRCWRVFRVICRQGAHYIMSRETSPPPTRSLPLPSHTCRKFAKNTPRHPTPAGTTCRRRPKTPEEFLWSTTWNIRELNEEGDALLDNSPSIKANRVRFPVGPPPPPPPPVVRIFARGNNARRYHWSAGLLGGLPFPPPLHSGACPYSLRLTLIGSQCLAVTSRPNLFAHSLGMKSHIIFVPLAQTVVWQRLAKFWHTWISEGGYNVCNVDVSFRVHHAHPPLPVSHAANPRHVCAPHHIHIRELLLKHNLRTVTTRPYRGWGGREIPEETRLPAESSRHDSCMRKSGRSDPRRMIPLVEGFPRGYPVSHCYEYDLWSYSYVPALNLTPDAVSSCREISGDRTHPSCGLPMMLAGLVLLDPGGDVKLRSVNNTPRFALIGSRDLIVKRAPMVIEYPPNSAIFFALLVYFEAANRRVAEKRSRWKLLTNSVRFERETTAIGTRSKAT
ncbi:hypothetical protein PR048_033406 [Dryococelus australis]|uniref:Uncharacterized protein n=1 Tax=Dryococelus australis TaxID=614101 RepID=A0ABQ9G065_9NEOP|nr:hypothetical protein PR048_033406 [Dryococelus australis]